MRVITVNDTVNKRESATRQRRSGGRPMRLDGRDMGCIARCMHMEHGMRERSMGDMRLNGRGMACITRYMHGEHGIRKCGMRAVTTSWWCWHGGHRMRPKGRDVACIACGARSGCRFRVMATSQGLQGQGTHA